MRCPFCENGDTRVIDTRKAKRQVRRRRECKECGERFSTIELFKPEIDALRQLAEKWGKIVWPEIIEAIQIVDFFRRKDVDE